MRAMRYLIVGSVALTLAFVVLLAPPPARGNDKPPPFIFADDSPLILHPSDLKEGALVTVLNNSASTVTLDVKLGPLRSPDGEDLPGDALEVTSKLSIDPAGSADIRIALQAGAALPATGAFNGSLAAWNRPDGPVIRRPIVVDSQEIASLPAPAVEIYTLRAVRWCPILCPTILIDPRLPVTGAATVAGAGEATLGVVTRAEGGAVRVFIDPGPAPASATAAAVQATSTSAPTLATATSEPPAEQPPRSESVRLGTDGWQPLRGTGKYQGTIDLLPDQEAAGEVDLTILVTDLILWPLLVIAAGVGIAHLAKLFVGPRRERTDLQRRVHAAHGAFNDADHYFRVATKGKPYGCYQLQFDQEADRLIAAIRALKPPLDESNTAYTTVQSGLQTIEATPGAWREFASDLGKLDAAAAVLRRNVQGRHPPLGAAGDPALLTHIDGLLLTAGAAPDAAKTLATVQDFQTRRTQVRDATAVAGRWPTLLERAERFRTTADVLRWQLDDAWRDDLDDRWRERLTDQETKLTEAEELLREASSELWRAEDADDFTRKAPGADLDRVEQLLARLTPLRLPPAVDAEIEVTAVFVEGDPGGPTGLRVGRGPLPAGTGTTSVEPRRPEPAILERYHARTLRRWDRWLTLVALVIALITGLNTLYFGKTFGTLGDYAAAFLFGAGVNSALQSASSAFELLLQRRTATPG